MIPQPYYECRSVSHLQLEKSEHAPAYHLLNVFAHGTLAEYNGESLALEPSYLEYCSSGRSKFPGRRE